MRCVSNQLSAPLTPNPSPTRGEGGSFGWRVSLAETLRRAPLLPWWEKVAAKRSDEGGAAMAGAIWRLSLVPAAQMQHRGGQRAWGGQC